jgi:hypothetical protein
MAGYKVLSAYFMDISTKIRNLRRDLVNDYNISESHQLILEKIASEIILNFEKNKIMKASELRIGNILFRDGFEVEVDSIQKELLAVKGENFYNPIKFFEPILINAEWFNKLGLNLRLIDKGDGIKQRFWHSPHFGRHNEHYLEL